MDETPSASKQLEINWKMLTIIGGILTTGFAAAVFVMSYQTKAEAKEQHTAIREDIESAVDDVESNVNENSKQLRKLEYITVHIAAEQRNANDRLKILITAQERARSSAARAEQIERIEALEQRIRRRESEAPPAPPELRDPLDGL